ncbi:MAG: hypothetical protein PW786_02525 [Arachidicoccus sp.]|nr:hypothetical protein [Arachidicoccus sp.]
MKRLIALAFLLPVYICKAQNNGKSNTPSEKAIAYYTSRKKISIPNYDYSKIEKIINKIKPTSEEDADGENYILNSNIYNRLSLREKFTYNMIHPEKYVQNYDSPQIEEDADKKIYAYPPEAFNNSYWSKRQTDFFKNNRDSILFLTKECIENNNRIGSNYKQVIIDLNAIELIPVLIKTVKETETDHDILTVLNLLMKYGNYVPFTKSQMYETLYGSDDASSDSFISFNKENEDLILKNAMDFYNENIKKPSE